MGVCPRVGLYPELYSSDFSMTLLSNSQMFFLLIFLSQNPTNTCPFWVYYLLSIVPPTHDDVLVVDGGALVSANAYTAYKCFFSLASLLALSFEMYEFLGCVSDSTTSTNSSEVEEEEFHREIQRTIKTKMHGRRITVSI